MIKKPTFPLLISFLHPGKYAYPGWYDPAGNFIWCMCHVLYINWLVYIYGISTTSLARHKSVWYYLFQCHAQCLSCVTSIMGNPLEVPEVVREGPRGPKSCLVSYICLQTVGRFLHLWYKNFSIYEGHMKTLSSRCVLVLIVLFIWLHN